MKRLFCILALLLTLCCVFAACDEPACQHRDANDDALCDTCGEAYTDGTESPEHTHAFGEWSVTTPATCTEKGVETRTCACGESETREIAKNMDNHSAWGTWGVTTPATCQAKGVETRTCACGKNETRDIAKNMDNHSAWGTWGVTAPATCGTTGVEARTCACGESETREIAATGAHDFTVKCMTVEYVHTAPTCQRAGTYFYKCSACTAKGGEPYEGGSAGIHVMDENHICTTCSNAYIYFGEYPQTLKADDVTITATTDSRGYYLGSDNAYYAKVTADPYENSYTFSDGSTVTDGTVYYFKVEPILWRILSQSDDTALILCDSIIANKAYGSSNIYNTSSIRTWLNAEFYNTAFTALEQELILTTTVDNSAASTGYANNPYACANTNDKVFLLSYVEVTNSAYGFNSYASRQMQTSDYSRATGAYMNTSTGYYGNGIWRLRSPYFSNSNNARDVDYEGWTSSYGLVSLAQRGVVPALQIRLS